MGGVNHSKEIKAVFEEVSTNWWKRHEILRELKPTFTSGLPATELSDVDINILVEDANLGPLFDYFKGMFKCSDHRGAGYVIVRIPKEWFRYPVELRFTTAGMRKSTPAENVSGKN